VKRFRIAFRTALSAIPTEPVKMNWVKTKTLVPLIARTKARLVRAAAVEAGAVEAGIPPILPATKPVLFAETERVIQMKRLPIVQPIALFRPAWKEARVPVPFQTVLVLVLEPSNARTIPG
jgi:hypothetical protein